MQLDAAVLARMVDDARRPGVPGRPANATRTSVSHDGAHFGSTLRRSTGIIAASARSRDRQKGRQSDVNRNLLLDMIIEQGGLCSYSGIPMELLRPHSHWRMSIERIDNSVGYVRGNYCLIAAEFNCPVHGVDSGLGSSQWSKQKVKLVNSLRNQPVPLPWLQENIQLARSRSKIRANASDEFRGPDADGKVLCAGCKVWQEQKNFYYKASSTTGLFTLCKKCGSQVNSAYLSTLRGHGMTMLGGARRRASSNSAWRGTFALAFEDLLDMLWQQGGRCFYSGVPLHCAKGPADWVWSIERLDNSTTYTRSNCVLIAREFNTADLSLRARSKSEVFGSSQWSRNKARHIWGSFTPNE